MESHTVMYIYITYIYRQFGQCRHKITTSIKYIEQRKNDFFVHSYEENINNMMLILQDMVGRKLLNFSYLLVRQFRHVTMVVYIHCTMHVRLGILTS